MKIFSAILLVSLLGGCSTNESNDGAGGVGGAGGSANGGDGAPLGKAGAESGGDGAGEGGLGSGGTALGAAGSSAVAASGSGGTPTAGSGGAASGGVAGTSPSGGSGTALGGGSPISTGVVQQYVNAFNGVDTTEKRIVNAIPNSQAAAWIASNVPLFECSDKSVEELYYFRWWSYRKNIKKVSSGYIVTEFLFNVGWAGLDNSISDAAGHHFYEGRWINNRQYLQDYAKFWLRTNTTDSKGVLSYSSWIPAGIYANYLVDGNLGFITDILNDAVSHYRAAEKKWFDVTPGLYHINPDRDAMEDPISGTGQQYRPTINAYAYGNALAISRMADLTGNAAIALEFANKASAIKGAVQNLLWDKDAKFFKIAYRDTTRAFADVREEIGFVPWYFSLPTAGAGYEAAWGQLTDNSGFRAAYGPTTAEQRHPKFRADAGAKAGEHETQWNGPSWPFATSQTLVAMANVIRGYTQTALSKADYFATFDTYTRSQHKDGHPWIAEDLNPLTGKWIADIPGRSEYYNHSTYADLVIAGLVGIVPREDSTIEINPLLPDGAWDYFYLDNVLYHGHRLTIFYDKAGTRYRNGSGMFLYVDGKQAATSSTLSRITFAG